MEAREILIEAKKAIIEEEEKKKELNVLRGKVATFEQEIEKLEKAKQDCIEKTIKEKKSEIEKSYDDLMISTSNKIKQAREQKEKEVKKNKKAQIEKDTKEAKDNNKYLKNRIKSLIKEKNLPFFVNSDLYFSIFKYETPMSIVRALIVALIFFGLIPFLFIKIDPFKWFTTVSINIKIFVYIVNFLIWGLIYLGISKALHVDNDTIKEIMDIRKEIRENKKQIKNITDDINKNTDESNYDYSRYNKEIEQGSNDLKILGDKRDAALENFNNVVEAEIVEGIEKEAEKDINEAKNNLEKAKASIEKEEQVLSEIKQKIEDEYRNILGKENLTLEKIDKMIDIANENEGIDIDTCKLLAAKK